MTGAWQPCLDDDGRERLLAGLNRRLTLAAMACRCWNS